MEPCCLTTKNVASPLPQCLQSPNNIQYEWIQHDELHPKVNRKNIKKRRKPKPDTFFPKYYNYFDKTFSEIDDKLDNKTKQPAKKFKKTSTSTVDPHLKDHGF